MPRFGDVLFSGSRFIFWAVTPFLILFVVVSFLWNPWTPESIAVTAGLDLIAILLILVLYNPQRFHWAARCVTGLVFLAYLFYFVSEAANGKPWTVGRQSETTPLKALFGFLLIGLPCLRYMLVGRFGWWRASPDLLSKCLSEPCVHCGKPLSEHDRALFAFTFANEANASRREEFVNKVKVHDWRSLALFQDWEDGDPNTVEAYVVRCVSGGAVVVLWDPYETRESYSLYMREEISAPELSEIERIIPPAAWQKPGVLR